MEGSVLILIGNKMYEVRSNEWYKEQVETMISATAEFSSNFSDFHPSASHVEMFLDIITNVFELKVVPQDLEIF